MSYRIVFTKHAASVVKKLPPEIKERIELSLLRIQSRPFDFLDKLTGYPYFKLRVGDYRIIIDIIRKELVILVVEVGHRRKIYKNMK
ncbi:MAG: type II toxin-antitoxin system RelE family toxin [Candidatus Hodarchaeales archaeon]|jgi:mRNA interferase RelE/StbE